MTSVEDLSALLDNAYVRMILNNPDHHPAILDAMGLDVREGWRNAPFAGIYSVACGTEPMPDVKYLVVWPKGVTT